MKLIRNFFVVLVLFVSLFSYAERFPVGPNSEMTPGSLCQFSNTKRYPEGITYCERNVETQLKKEIIKKYDEVLGFEIRQMNRADFKIDHFIPLSIGGSNNQDNLWPQHKSVFTVTDPLEHELAAKISSARITQAEAVRVIREAKNNLGRVPELLDYVKGL